MADEPVFPATELHDGDVLLFHGKSTLSKLIRLFDGTDVSHAGLYREGGRVAEALGKGLERRDLPTSIKDNDWVRVMRHTNGLTDLAPVARCCEAYLAKPNRYGYEQILLLAVLGTTRKIPVNGFLAALLRQALDGAASLISKLTSVGREPLICSEFVYRCYDEADPAKNDPYTIEIDLARGRRAAITSRIEPGSLLDLAITTPAPRVRMREAPARATPDALEAAGRRYLAEVAKRTRVRARAAEAEMPLDELRPALVRFAQALAVARGRTRARDVPAEGAALRAMRGAVADFVTPGDLLFSPSLERKGLLDKATAPSVVTDGAVRARGARGRGRGIVMPKGLAVCVGLNAVDPAHYQGWSGHLNACEADANDMASLATAQGYTTEKLLTKKATRKAVAAAVKRAAAKLRRGDIFFLTYSGHGGQVPDQNGDESDLKDETWCLYDGELIDDELSVFWSWFAPGVRVLLLSDSCHSGSVARVAYNELVSTGALRARASASHRDEAPVFRAMPDEVAIRTYRANKKFYDKIMSALPKSAPPVNCTVRLISGCQDNQLSQDGTFNGLFTGTMLRVWAGGKFVGDYAKFHRAIVKLMPPTQTPNHFMLGVPNPAYDHQKPFKI